LPSRLVLGTATFPPCSFPSLALGAFRVMFKRKEEFQPSVRRPSIAPDRFPSYCDEELCPMCAPPPFRKEFLSLFDVLLVMRIDMGPPGWSGNSVHRRVFLQKHGFIFVSSVCVLTSTCLLDVEEPPVSPFLLTLLFSQGFSMRLNKSIVAVFLPCHLDSFFRCFFTIVPKIASFPQRDLVGNFSCRSFPGFLFLFSLRIAEILLFARMLF